MAIRHLYANPFQLPFHTSDEDEYCTDDDDEGEERVIRGPSESIDTLARMLLTRSVPGSVPEVVAVVFPELATPSVASSVNTTTATPNNNNNNNNSNSLDYMSHIRHLNLCTPVAYTWQHEIQVPPATLAYIQREDFLEEWETDNLVMMPACQRRLGLDPPDGPLPLYHQYFRVQLLREVNWMLVNGRAGEGRGGDGGGKILGQQLQSLAIPVSDLERYVESVEKFESLEHVQFCLDEILSYTQEDIEEGLGDDQMESSYYRAQGIPDETDDNARLLRRMNARKMAAMQSLVQFVEEHGRLFPGQLKTVTCPESNIWEPQSWMSLPQVCPAEILFRILELLPALRRPCVLDDGNWMQFLAHPTGTYLGDVKEIDVDMESHSWLDTYGKLVENRGFLQKCRGLRKLNLGSLGKEAYKWAVEEKKALLENNYGGNSDIAKGTQGRSELQDQHLYLRHGLVPLEKVYFSSLNDVPLKDMDEVNDIAYAFSETLTTINVNMPCSMSDMSDINPEPPVPLWTIRLGAGWVDLPNLRDLYIDARVARLVLEPELLSHCPNLVNLNLYDDVTYEYQPSEAIQTGCLPAQLRKVESMTLLGWTALTFHPATLPSMSESLEVLSVQIASWNDELCIIPAVTDNDYDHALDQEKEQDQGQLQYGPGYYRWTWDWELPLLTNLELNSKFAYEFKFQMLAGCPLLKSLYLNIHTDTEHTRYIDRSVLYTQLTAPALAPGAGVGVGEKRIVLHKLRNLTMLGAWEMVGGDAFVEEFLGSLFPNLDHLVARHWKGVTISGFLSILRNKSEEESSPASSSPSGEPEQERNHNRVRKMDLAGQEMHGDEGRLDMESAQALGLVFKGYGDEEDVIEGEVLRGVEFSYEYSKFYVIKSPR
ncbi:hypothetical protein BGZ96_001275 [Linnemannia gamsii]|uniref:F-box domain-containing protein n=1 Tax=Linnemannia gamsii TaxID=64522 RepID=A0ABQ7JMS2_9FUNG|nr:hypothetical protein BGZ96_001275 [Linnemannia gamsii]